MQALLVVDVQNDFCPGGKLAVPKGDEIVGILDKYIDLFRRQSKAVYFSRDWHPKKTAHFKEFGGPWPQHCVARTWGSEFHKDLLLDGVVLSKGMDPGKDSYSAFQAVDRGGRTLETLLRLESCDELYVGGLATDYCVRASVIDALEAGLKVFLLQDAVRGVDVKPGDSVAAVRQMKECGARILSWAGVVRRMRKKSDAQT